MYLSAKSLVLAWLIAPSAWCATSSEKTATIATLSCSTLSGNGSISPAPRTTYTSTTASYITTTTTVTPATTIYISTTNVTRTSLKTRTSTVTQSTTIYLVVNSTATTTIFTGSPFIITTQSTSTRTNAILFANTTILAPTHFTPIQSAFPGGSKRRDVDELHLVPRAAKDSTSLNATSVICTRKMTFVTTTIYTTTAPTTTTIVASAKTATATTTSTTIRTTTLAPPSTTITSTIYSTTFAPSTITSTAYTTVTFSTATTAPTAYAVCEDPLNYLTNYAGAPIDFEDYDFAMSFSPAATSAHDCCVACQRDTTCGVSVFLAASAECVLFANPGECRPKTFVGTFYTGNGTGYAVTLSNGACGQWEYGGEHDSYYY